MIIIIQSVSNKAKKKREFTRLILLVLFSIEEKKKRKIPHVNTN